MKLIMLIYLVLILNACETKSQSELASSTAASGVVTHTNNRGSVKTYQLTITGKVQGVWFRASAKDVALSHGLTGRVWNESDGSVSAIVQGPEDKIKAFIEWCKKGPREAEVSNVDYSEINDGKTYSKFEIVGAGN